MSLAPVVCQNRDEWLAVRSTGIGASEAAALLGLSRFKNAFELWHEKKGLVPPNKAETFARKIGLQLEDPIAEMYRSETGRSTMRPAAGKFIVHRNAERPYLLATLDGATSRAESAPDPRAFIFTAGGIISFDSPDIGPWECKTAAFIKRAEWESAPPLEYIVQVQHQLMVTGAQWGSLAALVGGVYFVWADIERDQELIDGLIRVEEEFYASLQGDTPPAPDGSAITRAVIHKLFPKELDAQPAVLPVDALEWDAKRQGAKEEIKRQEIIVQEAEANIKLAIGEHAGSGLMPNGTRYTWKTINKKPYSVTPKPYRELRRFAPKGEKESAIKPGEAPELDLGGFDE